MWELALTSLLPDPYLATDFVPNAKIPDTISRTPATAQ